MSCRRAYTESPLIGCSLKASPVATQSRRSPDSKSRLSGLPSMPFGSVPAGTSDLGLSWAPAHAERAATSRMGKQNQHTKRMGEFFLNVANLNAVTVATQLIRIAVAMVKVTKYRVLAGGKYGSRKGAMTQGNERTCAPVKRLKIQRQKNWGQKMKKGLTTKGAKDTK